MADRPSTGDEYYRSLTVGAAVIEVLAEVEVDGDTIHLRDLAVYPVGTNYASVGAHAIYRAFREEMAREAREWGFGSIRISGIRYSGASPGRSFDRLITLDESDD